MLNLDIGKELSGGHIVHGRAGDNKSCIEKVSVIKEDGTPFDLTGLTITFMGNTYNYQTKVISSDGIEVKDAKKGLFQYTFPSEAFGVAGPYERSYFQFTDKNGVVATTGDFEVIVLDNTDLTANEAETIISEYNKLVEELQQLQKKSISDLRQQQEDYVIELAQAFAELKSDVATLESKIKTYETGVSKTATDAQNAVDTAATNANNTISTAATNAAKMISDALEEFQKGNFWTKEESFNKEQSSANVIDQVIGKEKALITLRADYSGKIFESLEENVNVAKRSSAGNGSPTRILSPNEFSTEVNQGGYDLIAQEDANVYNLQTYNDNGIMQVLFQYNVVEILERQLGEDFFKDRGATSLLQKTAVVREIITVINPAVWGYGSSKTGNKLNYRVWINNSSWGGARSNNSSTVTKIEYSTTDSAANNYISDDGYLYAIAYTEPRTGSISSVLNIDYAALDITIELSAREHIEYMIAAYCGEKESGTWIQKEQSLGADEDMNDFNEIGTYTVSYNHRINQPANIGSQQGWLTVYQASPTSSVVSQEVIYPNAGASKGGARMFARNLLNKNTNLWDDWQEITKLFASQLEVNNGTSDDKMISPKTLADTIKFKEVFKEGIALSNVAKEGTLVPHGDSVGGSLNHVDNRPYTVNSDGTFTFNKDCTVMLRGGARLVVGDTNPTDYLYISAYVNNTLNEFILLGSTLATNGTLKLSWSTSGSIVLFVKSGDVLSLKVGLRSGKQASSVMLKTLEIEEV